MARPNLARGSKTAQCLHYCRIVTTFLFSHVGLCLLVLAYAFGGAFTFHHLESEYEEKIRNRTKDERDELVEKLWDLTENQTVLVFDVWIASARQHLMEFEEGLLKAVKNDGYDGNEYTAESQWSVTGSMLFSIIVITTIGYGNIAPKTAIGRLVTMLYAIFGIPLMLLFLSNIGDVMAHSFKFLYWKVCYTLCIKQKKRKKKRHRHHRRHQVVEQQPSRIGGLPGSPTESIPMQPMGASAQPFGAPYYGPGSSHTLPSSSRRQHGHVTQFSDHHDAAKVPIISNKYALQTDIGDDPPGPFGFSNRFSTLPSNLTRTQMMRPPPLSPQTSYGHSQVDYDSYSESSESEEDEEEGVPIFMIMSVVIGYICGGAWLFRQWETSWSYLDSAYFCFVTLTTIGFGDMVPGSAVISGDGQSTLIICAFYLLFGMALLAMSFNLVQEEVAKSVRVIGKKIGIVSDNGDKDS